MNKTFIVALAVASIGVNMTTLDASAQSQPWPPMPEPGAAPSFTAPQAIQFTLSNGIPVSYIPAGKVPITHVQLNAYTGYAHEDAGERGLAVFAARMPLEGTKTRTGLEISGALQNLASSLHISANLEYSEATLNALDDNLDATLAILAEVLKTPALLENDVERIRKNLQNAIFTEKDNLRQTADKVFRKVLFGDNYLGRWHRGSHESIQAISRQQLDTWHRAVWHPGNIGITIVSGLPREEIEVSLENAFGTWEQAPQKSSTGKFLPVAAHDGVKIYWVQKDGASQSVVSLGNTAPAFDAKRSTAIQAGNRVLGGQFTSRINMNLREDKGYTYGARSAIHTRTHGGYYRAMAAVKASTTALSIVEFVKELGDIAEAKPITPKEFKNATGSMLQGWPAYFEKASGVLGQYAAADANKRPAGWLNDYGNRVADVTLAAALKELGTIINTQHMAIVVVGDWKAAGPEVAALNLGPVIHLNHDGMPLPPTGEVASQP